jgi:hypothetical protein
MCVASETMHLETVSSKAVALTGDGHAEGRFGGREAIVGNERAACPLQKLFSR